MGNYAQAEPLFQRALKIDEKVIGPEHFRTATSLSNLAGLYQDVGDYAKAEPLYQRALKIYEKELGPDQADTAESLNNLGWLYFLIGDYAKAEPLYQRALKIYEKALGPDHPDTGMKPQQSGCTLYDLNMGDYAKAEPLYQRALRIAEKAFGADHTNTAASLNNLAALYVPYGRLRQGGTALLALAQDPGESARTRTSQYRPKPEQSGVALL